jgi:hypothetical protein
MPNHCENDLYVWGTEAAVTKLIEAVRGEGRPLDFHLVVPYPNEFESKDDAADEFDKAHEGQKVGWENRPKDGFNSGGMDWCCENWGTKWNSYNISDEQPMKWERVYASSMPSWDYIKMRIQFSTAWGPPSPIIKQLMLRFPEVGISLEYFERGCEFCGGISAWAADEREDMGGIREWHLKGYKGVRGG